MNQGVERRNPFEGEDNPHEQDVLKVGNEITSTNGRKYKLTKLLGTGGMGKVFEAKETGIGEDEGTGIKRAIKFMHFESRSNDVAKKRFQREVKVLTSVKDQFILDVIDVEEFQVGNEVLTGFVTDFVNGPDLDKEIIEKGSLEIKDVLKIIGQIALALEALREKGIVHRDLKPANIFLEKMPNGESVVRVGDFGIVGLERDGSEVIDYNQIPPVVEGHITNPNFLTGSPEFMSPEVIKGEEVTHKSDLYALGLVLYEMISGHNAFPGNSAQEVLMAQIRKTPLTFSEMGIEVPNWLEEATFKLMEKEPDDRFDTAMDFLLFIKEGIKKDYPELMREVPFIYDTKKTESKKQKSVVAA